jgi:predicted PurR-regulated permease PerM
VEVLRTRCSYTDCVNRTVLIKAEKWAIWAGLIGIIVLLRHLFPVFFLTFVLSYIANTGVKALGSRISHRRVGVVIVYLTMLTVLTGIGVLVVPRMISEARNLARLYITTEAARGDAAEGAQTEESVGVIEREAREMLDAFIISVAGHDTFYSFRESDAYAVMVARLHNGLANATPRVIRGVTIFANEAFAFIFAFLISIILSFLMVWNLPATRERMLQFQYGRTAEIYAEIAPGLRAFGVMLGRAFEAQTVVAIVNAVLSAIAFVALGLPSIALLATIVFFCSYIPILGMILSTLPAALLAFKLGGFTRVIWLLVAILVIHAVEAYLLNPLIYGRHLRLHPLAVLVILLVAEEVFGVWGLILGVPVAAFILKYGIEGEDVERTKPKVEEEAPAPLPADA